MEDFGVVQKIETTIAGLLTFAVRFLRTTLFLGLHPRCLGTLPSTEGNGYVFSHPYTYLTLTAVIFAPMSRFLARLIAETIDAVVNAITIGTRILYTSPNIGASPREAPDVSFLSLLRNIPDPSVDTIIKVSLPIILAITVLAALVGTVLQRSSRIQRADFIRIACFVAGFQFVIFTTAVAVLSGIDLLARSESVSALTSTRGADIVIGAFICALLYTVLWPALQLFFLLAASGAASRVKRWLKTVATLGVAIALSCLFVMGATSVSLIPLAFEPPKTPTPPEYIWSVESLEVVEGNRLNARVLLASNRPQPYLILDTPISLSIYTRTGVFRLDRKEIARVPLALIAWSDRDRPVLEVRRTEAKWMILEGALEPAIVRDLQGASPGKLTMVISLQGFARNDHLFIEYDWKPYK